MEKDLIMLGITVFVYVAYHITTAWWDKKPQNIKKNIQYVQHHEDEYHV